MVQRPGFPGRRLPTLRAVDDVDLRLRRGRTLNPVGGSGSGKSAAAHLVPRLADASCGHIQFDGADVGQWPGDLIPDSKTSGHCAPARCAKAGMQTPTPWLPPLTSRPHKRAVRQTARKGRAYPTSESDVFRACTRRKPTRTVQTFPHQHGPLRSKSS
ncbi:ATP-binding cassette domain-containing protein [Streptomyces sp. CA-249302]|uniref:ATP-binding cassette domain-containing protein n=1 Tax=Streptomyces sp. CA-249302 TaxID=3240058 RepID=UPI003D930E86